MSSSIPTEMEELEATRQKLLKDIAQAEKLFATDPGDVCALNTVKSGLKYIEQMIEDLRTR
jgi:hypothetical protein